MFYQKFEFLGITVSGTLEEPKEFTSSFRGTKKEFPDKNIFVAGYSNEVMCYIPSERVLKEGGYEADSSMIYYGMPGPFENGIEEKIMAAIYLTIKKIK